MSHQMQQPTRSAPAPEAAEPESAASKLFDLRVLIGSLFTFYGLVLIVTGLVASSAELRKASGININLWTGLGMLVVGVLFLVWWRTRPLRARPEPAPPRMQPQPPRR